MAAKVKISDEEFEQLESSKRHEELLAALGAIARREDGGLEAALVEQSRQIALLAQRADSSSLAAELKPLIKQLIASVKDLQGILARQSAPASFRVQRGSTGLIEKVVVEKLSGN